MGFIDGETRYSHFPIVPTLSRDRTECRSVGINMIETPGNVDPVSNYSHPPNKGAVVPNITIYPSTIGAIRATRNSAESEAHCSPRIEILYPSRYVCHSQ